MKTRQRAKTGTALVLIVLAVVTCGSLHAAMTVGDLRAAMSGSDTVENVDWHVRSIKKVTKSKVRGNRVLACDLPRLIMYRLPKPNAEAIARILQAKFKGSSDIAIVTTAPSKIMVVAGLADQDEVAQWIPQPLPK